MNTKGIKKNRTHAAGPDDRTGIVGSKNIMCMYEY